MEHLDLAALLNDYVIPWGLRIALALGIFLLGRAVVRALVNAVQGVLEKRNTDEVLVRFLCSIMRWVLLLFVVIASLSQLGIDTTSLIALLGAAGLAIGLALQGSLSNFAAGVMLIIFRPFKKGDFVEAGGAMGVIDSISIFTTTLTTPDNKEIIVPNGTILANNITNFSARPTRRVDMVFGISYDDDIRRAKQILEDIVSADSRVLAEPAPVVALNELGESSVNFIVRPWVKAADYWPLKWDITAAVKERFDAENITIPYPQMDLHIQRRAEENRRAA